MFVNYSNHPVEKWSEKQLLEAKKYGDIIEVPFFSVPAHWETLEVKEQAKKEKDKILSMIKEKDNVIVLCQGEATLQYQLVKLLLAEGIRVVCACSERVSEEDVNGDVVNKISRFEFCGFRDYE